MRLTDKPNNEPTSRQTNKPTDTPTIRPRDKPTGKPSDQPTPSPTEEQFTTCGDITCPLSASCVYIPVPNLHYEYLCLKSGKTFFCDGRLEQRARR